MFLVAPLSVPDELVEMQVAPGCLPVSGMMTV
jgi:hypothetical protein